VRRFYLAEIRLRKLVDEREKMIEQVRDGAAVVSVTTTTRREMLLHVLQAKESNPTFTVLLTRNQR